VFGAFLAGIAIGDSPHLRQQTRTTIDHFVSSFFAPLFFASIGLRVDFAEHFDLVLVLTIFGIASAGKLCGGLLGARCSGLRPRNAWAVGFALNARGAMEIVLGLLALRTGLVHPRLFVALVIMALATSVLGGPLMRAALRRPQRWSVTDLIVPKTFVRRLAGTTRDEALKELVAVACAASGLEELATETAVRKREAAGPTGIENGLAIAHACMPGLSSPVVVAALSERGIDFDAPDGRCARVIFLVLTAPQDGGAQIEIMSGIARGLRHPGSVDLAVAARNLAGFVAVLREGLDLDERQRTASGIVRR
jgi:mannitol/fructose-specific phosphotransferase system IIA component (Ntr-type)